MGARYSTTGEENAVTAALTTAVGLTGGTGLRIRLYEFAVSAGGTPADNVLTWAGMRYTVAPTMTGVTPEPLDPADPAAEATGGENASAEGTQTAGSEWFHLDVNQRATYRWIAAPNGEIVVPATAANGLSGRVLSPAYTGVAKGMMHHEE